MNKMTRALCISGLLVTTAALSTVVPYLQFRSQGFNAARELVGWQTQINKPEMCNFYGSFSITPEYTRSFKPNRISNYLFADALIDNPNCPLSCNDSCGDNSTILIQGTKVASRDAKALMAENFYLPTDFSSKVSFKPTIDNFLVDFNLYLGLDNWCEGLYFRVHMPVCYTRWDLKFCEEVVAAGTQPYDPGYFNDTTTPAANGGVAGANPAIDDPTVYGLARNKLLNSFQEYASSQGTITGVDGITFNPLNNARMDTCRRHKTAVAELTAALGWNFLNCPDYTLGLNIRGAAPTGNRPEGVWLFEPIVGQGKHWELGAGLDARWVWWRSCDESRDFTVYLDANVTHLFKTRQCRTFDLCNKPLSRYMLAMKFTDKVENLVGVPPATGTAPKYQFAKEFAPVANLTTLPVDVSAAVQGEVALKFAYTHCNWQFDVGYDFWGRSCEKICQRCDGFKNNVWGLKGDAFVFGFPGDVNDPRVATDTLSQPAIALSATQSKATIFKGTNNYGQTTTVAGVATPWNGNPGIDNPLSAVKLLPAAQVLYTHQNGVNAVNTPNVPSWTPVFTSVPPVLLSESDIDFNGARADSMSNKIFGHIGYVWKECECWTPYLGVGGEAEFGMWDKNCDKDCNKGCKTSCPTTSTTPSTSSTCNTSCKTSCNDNTCCKTVSLSQWGVWVKGGFSFN